MQRGAHNFHLSPLGEGREMRHEEMKKENKEVHAVLPASLMLDKHVCQSPRSGYSL